MKIGNHFDIKRKIEILQRLSIQRAAPSEFVLLLRDLLPHALLTCVPLADENIYRARFNEPGRLFSDVSELKHPKAPLRKNRLNDVGEPFFYGAACELGTIYEMVPPVGSLFTMSRITKQCAKTPFFCIAGLVDDPRFPEPKGATEKAVFNYLHSELTKIATTPDDYNSTIALSRFYLDKELSAPNDCFLGGLIYPSVQMARGVANVRTFNYGIRGHVFDENFRIRDACVYCFTFEEDDRYHIHEVNFANISEDGRLNWRYDFSEMQRRMRSGIASNGEITEALRMHVPSA